ncbi:hypothetical protein QUF88_15435 [Bacillus sp. DX1.1]|uniref:hypothetical protein n=1 Tax=unclassified Bacillus (in: firmicutes) TaxID=185979 RepID=UPI0025712396|nr:MULTISPECIES: hypothetical protein [unclassified Bacillus (in: firmicutes)]MDM5155152.1 hypothetical protein [Bacillus sp. DX1.1]WJE79480.1 hypothetical protein QRE67_12930 [Bacillus sp. DX3.1]
MRRKRYKRGDRIKINLNKCVSPELISWINNQSDITKLFLYGVQQLYKQVGDIDVAKVLPNNHVFSLHVEAASLLKIEVNPLKEFKPIEKGPSQILEQKVWNTLDRIDCPYF